MFSPKQIENSYEAAETANHSESTIKRSQVGFLHSESHNHRFLQHNYRDYSLEVPDTTDLDFLKRKVNSFPLKLHRLLDKIESDGLAHVVSWQPHGRSFAVHKPEEFVDILPKYFKQTKLSSFQRQLNIYGFMRFSKGRDRGAYHHELFLRGRPFLCRRMVRTTVKGTGVRTPSNPDMEPNFYAVKFVLKQTEEEEKKNEKKVVMIDAMKAVEEKMDVSEDRVVRNAHEKVNGCHISNDVVTVPYIPMNVISQDMQQTGANTRGNDVTSEMKDDEEEKKEESEDMNEKKKPVVSLDSSIDDETIATEERSSYSSIDEVFNGSLDDLLVDSSCLSSNFNTDPNCSFLPSEEENASFQSPSYVSKMDQVVDDLFDYVLTNVGLLHDVDDVPDRGIKLGYMLDDLINSS